VFFIGLPPLGRLPGYERNLAFMEEEITGLHQKPPNFDINGSISRHCLYYMDMEGLVKSYSRSIFINLNRNYSRIDYEKAVSIPGRAAAEG
jgi:hypothetical protein